MRDGSAWVRWVRQMGPLVQCRKAADRTGPALYKSGPVGPLRQDRVRIRTSPTSIIRIGLRYQLGTAAMGPAAPA